MTAAFDPYHRWLGIASHEQPPNHYRLLGLNLFEGDADVIESAADKQMAHVRTFQSGRHADDAQRILNEISAARVLLLNQESKSAYDAQLRAKIDRVKKKRKQERSLPVAEPLESTGGSPAPASRSDAPTTIETGEPPVSTSGVPKTIVYAAIAGGAALLLIVGAIAIVFQPWATPPEVAGAGEVNNTANTVSARGTGSARVSDPAEGPTAGLPGAEEGDPRSDNGRGQRPAPNIDPPAPDIDPPATNHDRPAPDPIDNDPEPIDPPTVETPDPPPVEVAVDPPPPTGPQKTAVPDAAARTAARQKIADVLPVDDARAPDEKSALAAQLLNIARETKDDPTARFVLLNLAREQAAGAAKVRLAFEAIDLLEAEYDFDVAPVRLATLGEGARSSLPPDQKREVIEVGIEMMDAMMLRDEYASADKLVDPLLDLARRAKDKPLTDAIAERRRRAGQLADAYKRAKPAIETLKNDPDNAEANLAAGRYYLFAKEDWATALPMLAKSGDEKLSAAAKAEMARPTTTEQEEKLAAAWWAIAEAETESHAKSALEARSMAWYQRAADKLVGLSKVQAQRRIDDLANAGIRPANLAANLGIFSRPPSGLGTSPIGDTGEPANVELKFTNLSPDTRLTTLEVGSFRCTDQFKITGVPDELQRLNLLVMRRPREPRNPGPAWTFTVNQPVRVFLLHMNRGVYNADDWQRTEYVVAWNADDQTRFTDTVYVRDFPAGEVSVPRHIGRGPTGYFGVPHACAIVPVANASPAETTPKVGRQPVDDLVAHWTFDEGQGDVAGDAAGGHHGTVNGAVWTEGVQGGALHFDGQDDNVVIPAADGLNFEGPITLTTWIRFDSPQDGMDIVSRSGFGQRTGLEVKWGGYGSRHYLAGTWKDRSSEPSARATTPFPKEDARGGWIHLAGVYDGEAWQLYRNGKLEATAESALGAVKWDAPYVIGAQRVNSGNVLHRYFKGDIDDVRIYNRALTAEEVAALAAPPEDRPPAKVGGLPAVGLVAHWSFDEGQGDVAGDAVGGHDGRITRGTWTQGVHGKALHFDKQGGYVSIPGSPEFDEASRLSIAVWIKADGALESGMENVVTHLISGSTWEELRLVRFHDGDSPSYLGGFSKRGGGADKPMSKIPQEDDAAWVHLALTHDGESWRLFRNGVQAAQADSTLAKFSFNGQWLIGGFTDGRRYFHGDIDDVRIYNRAISAEEVAALAAPPEDRRPTKIVAEPEGGLVAYWTFDEGRGEVAGDVVGGRDGAIKGATWTDGVRGKALRFDGTSSMVDLGEQAALNFGGEMTMAAWIRPGKIPQGITFMNVLAHNHPSLSQEIYLRMNSGKYSAGCYTGRHIPTERGAPREDVGQWVHLAGVYDGESWHVYRNGEPHVSRKTDAGPLAFDGPWAIGAHPNKQERFFEGDMDEVRIYNRALSAEEVQALSEAK